MDEMPRVVVAGPQGDVASELPPGAVLGLVMVEEVNGEHSLEVTTSEVLLKNERLLTRDAAGKWREWVVEGVDWEHANGARPVGTYRAVWSLQHDLSQCTVSAMPGVQSPVRAAVALAAALGGTRRWGVGTVTRTATAGASMYQMSAWEAMGVLVENWGGEVDATVEVGTSGVTSRRVDLYEHQGSESAVRRFDWGADLTSISRSVSDEPVVCRIVPRGKGEETEGGGYGRKITIEDVNDGKPYLQDDESAAVWRLPDGSGGFEYPTRYVDNSDIGDKQALKDWGLSVIEEYTRPRVTYKASVLQFAEAGMDARGLALGDEVHCVDRGFSPDGLRVSGRVVRLKTNLLDPRDVDVTVGRIEESLTDRFASLGAAVSRATAAIEAINGGDMSTADYLSRLLERINAEINAQGGYTYITEGQGIRTYDRAVADPASGLEAGAVVEVKGGTVRIANTKTAQGEWDWKTVFTSGHIVASMVTAAQITAGHIGSAASGNYWDLDTGQFRMATGSVSVGSGSLDDYVAGVADGEMTQAAVFDALTDGGALQGLYMSGNELYVNGSYIKAGTIDADRIDASQLISGKIGNSSSEYASIGQTSVGGTSNGIVFYRNGSPYIGFTRGANGVFLSCADANGVMWPVVTMTDSQVSVVSPPGTTGDSQLVLSLTASGLTMAKGSTIKRVASF